MLFVFALTAVLLVLGIRNGDIELGEAAIYGGVSLALLAAPFVIRAIAPYWYFVPAIFIDIVLVLKVFGRDIMIH
ncbi:MAG TPA: hypothetical protein VKT77_21365 [Chthonomonadaceae bacterium]|nr:hypothetical protein [Chthonomonadaceae bacterium]